MSETENRSNRDVVFSKRIKAGKRVYFFDVKSTRGNDLYLTITESKRRPGETDDRPIFEKHKLFVYREDFDKFSDGFHEALDYIRLNPTERMLNPPVYASNGNGTNEPVESNDVAESNGIAESNGVAEEKEKGSFTDIEFDDLGS
ncbi:MAG: DUF3276 family protein [Bacteroidota bacterium]